MSGHRGGGEIGGRGRAGLTCRTASVQPRAERAGRNWARGLGARDACGRAGRTSLAPGLGMPLRTWVDQEVHRAVPTRLGPILRSESEWAAVAEVTQVPTGFVATTSTPERCTSSLARSKACWNSTAFARPGGLGCAASTRLRILQRHAGSRSKRMAGGVASVPSLHEARRGGPHGRPNRLRLRHFGAVTPLRVPRGVGGGPCFTHLGLFRPRREVTERRFRGCRTVTRASGRALRVLAWR
jgi:hypothetical protein